MKKIPKKEDVIEAVETVLKRRLSVNSLKELKDLVLEELLKKDRMFRLSENRLRKILAEIKGLKIVGGFKNKNCPICGSELYPVKVRNLKGDFFTIGFHCKKCGFRGLEGKIIRYKFVYVR